MHRLEDLKVWKKEMEVAEDIYLISADFPSDERLGITSQIKRCAVSIPSNIAEVTGRNTKGEFKNFISIANGSAYELSTQLTLAHKLKLIEKDEVNLFWSRSLKFKK